MIDIDRIFGMLGLAAKAKKLEVGAYLARAAVERGRARLVLVASDASENTKHSFEKKCKAGGVPYIEYGSSGELSKYIGKKDKVVVAVTDENFARGIMKIYGGDADVKTEDI